MISRRCPLWCAAARTCAAVERASAGGHATDLVEGPYDLPQWSRVEFERGAGIDIGLTASRADGADCGTVATDAPPPPESPVSTLTPTLRLTDNRLEVLTALARGYLRPYPHYDPRPEGYDDVAALPPGRSLARAARVAPVM